MSFNSDLPIQSLESAAVAGDTAALNSLAWYFAYELDPPDLKTARHWYEQWANSGDIVGMRRLGNFLVNRLPPAELDTARKWYEKAARLGDPLSMKYLGTLASHGPLPDMVSARAWYEKSANCGDLMAMTRLGQLLALEADPPEVEQGRFWLERAASHGFDRAARILVNLNRNRQH